MKTSEKLKLNDSVYNSEQLLQHMAKGVKDYAIFLLDAEGNVISWNEGAERIIGYQQEEVLGKHFSLFYTPEDIKINRPKQLLKTALCEGRSEDTGWRVRKDGTHFWANVVVTPVMNDNGELQGYTNITRDLTEQKKGEDKFRGLLESAPDAITIVNKRGRIVMVNAQTEHLFGYNREEMIGKDVEFLIPEEFREAHSRHRQKYNAEPKVRDMGIGLELYGRRKDGSEFPAEISLSPIEIADEGVMVFASIRDITIQKKSREEIKKLNEELDKRIAERTSELELSLNNEKMARAAALRNQQKIIFLSKASAVLSSSLDYFKTLNELVAMITPGFSDWCIIHEVQAGDLVKPVIISHSDNEKTEQGFELARKFPLGANIPKGLYKVLHTQKPIFFPSLTEKHLKAFTREKEYLAIIKNLHIKSLISVPLIIREQVYGIITLLLDSGERQFDAEDLEMAKEIAQRASLAIENGRLYQESRNLNAELEKRVARRTAELETMNKELESFSYSVSHDLRAPLRSIDGFSNMILRKYADRLDETGKDYFSRVIHASQQMGQLIDDLLKLSRITRIEMNKEITDLSEMADNITKELQAGHPQRKASFHIQPGMTANVDRNLIEIALRNMFDNSWKYSRNQQVSKIEFGSVTKADKKVYYIRDNGVGFDMKYADKLFGAFQRLHSLTEFEGTGIGLATVQRIIRRHGGKIWAEGEINKGATFYFTLK